MTDFQQLEIWFVTGSQHLYGEAVLAIVEQHSRKIAESLDGSETIPIHVVVKPVLTDSEGISAIVQEANASTSCVGLITWMHTFSPAKMWIAGLAALQKPLLHLHTQFNRELPWPEIDMDFMNLNQSAHGDREFAYMATRLRLPRKTVVGHWEDPAIQSTIGRWTRAAASRHEARHLKIARFGDNMRNVGVTEGDKVEAQLRIGFSVNTFGVNVLTDRIEEVGEAEVDILVDAYRVEYDLVPELGVGGDRHQSLREAARIEAGLRGFLSEGGFGAFTDTFEDLGRLAQLPGIAVQRLMADGYGFGAEGDWKTAALVRLIKVMGAGLPGGTSFMEDYTYHLTPENACVLGAHMLEVCPSIASGRPSCEIHPLAIGGRPDPVRLVFTAPPGPAFVVGLLDLGPRFRLVANLVEVVEPEQPLSNLPVARAVWQPRPSLAVAAETWLTAGGPHHTCFTQAVSIETLEDFADMIGIELVVIDQDTTAKAFKRELQWNQAYHHLAGAL